VVNYYELGADKRLNEIVFAGSHDAGITSGGGNVKTQGLEILGQALAGVRLFDLRIAAASVPTPQGQTKRVEMKAFHSGKPQTEVKTRDAGRMGTGPLVRTKLSIAGVSVGDWGLELDSMLQQARDFLRSADGISEFLILKFDKCQNWIHIAEACTYKLRGYLYTGRGSLNTKTLRDLEGKAIVVFGPKGVTEVAGVYGPQDGILGFQNLYEGGTYRDNFDGLQYYGKGGTSIKKPFFKQSQNVKKQRKLLQGAIALQNPQVMPMMYWTTTGIFESIENRNEEMWEPPNVQKMKNLWKSGAKEMVEYRNPLTLPQGSPLAGITRKRLIPNIVMMDFADPGKCQTIRDLNDMSPEDWAAVE
jgi:hypothetical protein